jgi:hypothetical protein
MPEIKHGISGWAEQKLWSLLVAIGEPNHVRYFAYCLLINLSLVFISRQ